MIESAKYLAGGAIAVVIDGIAMTVPDDHGNRHRQMLAAWETTGGTIFPYEAPPAPPVIIAYADFRARFTAAELEALFAAKSSHWQVEDLVILATAQNSVNLSGANAATAKGLFVTLGVLTEERAETIFAAE